MALELVVSRLPCQILHSEVSKLRDVYQYKDNFLKAELDLLVGSKVMYDQVSSR
jgi:hypothetical protein